MDTDSNINARPIGRIELILGPAFAGKTTELMRRVRRQRVAGKQCRVFECVRDPCYDDGKNVVRLYMYDKERGTALPAKTNLLSFREQIAKFDVVAIDEAQFFLDLVQFCNWVAATGSLVLVAALSGTDERKPFPVVAELISNADDVSFLHAVCTRCNADAAFSCRLGPSSKLGAVGSPGDRQAVCRRCHAAPSLQH